MLDALRGRGALFHSDLQAITDRLPTEIEEGLWDGVARGLVTADGFNAVRSLLHARTRFARRQRPSRRPGSRGRRGTWRQGVEGRWTLLPAAEPIDDVEELAETVAWQLLLRWGVVFRDVYLKERLAVPWREILWALRRLEARGLIRGGHFVTGVTGEQFAEETTVPLLRAAPRRLNGATRSPLLPAPPRLRPLHQMVHRAEPVGDAMLAAVPDQDHVPVAELCLAVGARGGGVGPGGLQRLSRLPVRALHRPRNDVLQPAEHRPAVAGMLG